MVSPIQASRRRSGGIGRRARFRTWYPLRVWRFESSLRQFQTCPSDQRPTVARLVSAADSLESRAPASKVVAIGLLSPQLTAFFTSAPILASSAAVNSFSAKAVGHMAPSSRFASCMKPNVAYLVLNFCALWKKQTTLPSLAYAGIPYQSLGERAGALA